MINGVRPSHGILQFLSEIFGVLLRAFEQKETVEMFVKRLNVLENKASTLQGFSKQDAVNTHAADTFRLYQIAALIYLTRVSESISGEPRNMQPLLDSVFAEISRMNSCDLQFPLLILGYEARTDEQRIIILDLIQKTEESPTGRMLGCFRNGLKALWVQEDLAADQEFVPNYMDRLSAIISKSRFIPSLV